MEAPPERRHPVIALLLFLTAVYAVGFVGSMGTLRGMTTLYPALAKPVWTPPAPVFAPVWTVLYALMGIAAWRVWRVEPGESPSGARTAALALFAAQLALNGLWPWTFFAGGLLGLSAAIIGLLLFGIAATTRAFFRVDPTAGGLMVPYLAWVAFATALNFAIWRMNPTLPAVSLAP